ncbi:hypothetical protein [Planctomyces sp. SH-PL62]|uniref:hypothetical protein n=1 Tax=Planctomyces sp. SH-PL62 TaxID=1636152 RepID=UPI00078E345A|nr:hypothetical protein [Planctomyces sp. SH-PL62]AMV39814.1 hypothetical protein VT85_20450 [Planctomyces sp. SH-PL62]
MRSLARLASLRVCDESTALRFAQAACFAAGAAILPVALLGLARFEPSRVEMLLGCLAASAVSVGFVTLGLILEVLVVLRSR